MTLDGWLTDGGELNTRRLQVLFDQLSSHDRDRFNETYIDFGAQDGGGRKKGKKGKSQARSEGSSAADPGGLAGLFGLIKAASKDTGGDNGGFTDDENDEDTDDADLDPARLKEQEFAAHKAGYYREKMHATDVNEAYLLTQARTYVDALQWVLFYYFRGCSSWGWFFPSHYAPYVSDIRGIADYKPEFELGRPFLPFQQLMAVLPAGSKQHVPPGLQSLMTSPDSPILDFYPETFETDLNGKKVSSIAAPLHTFRAPQACRDTRTDSGREMFRSFRQTGRLWF